MVSGSFSLSGGQIVLLPKLSSFSPSRPCRQPELVAVSIGPPRPIQRPEPPMSSSLLLTRRFAPLFWTQFFSAFSDNFLKNSLVFLILFHIGGSDAEALITLAAAVFIAPVFLSVRARRRTGRSLRQGGGGAAAQVRGDRHCLHRGARLCRAFGAVAVRRAVPVRRDRRAVRSDQVRHSSRPSCAIGTSRRQRPGGGRDLHRHSARHHRRRRRRQGRRRSLPFRLSDDRVLAHVLGREPAHPAHRPGGTEPGGAEEHPRVDRRPAEVPARPIRGCGGARW